MLLATSAEARQIGQAPPLPAARPLSACRPPNAEEAEHGSCGARAESLLMYREAEGPLWD